VIVALGYPLSGVLAADANVSVGNVSALAGVADDTRYLQISAPVQPGNSGGPLLDASGHLVGIVTSKLDAMRVARFTGDIPQNVNFALKAEVARTFLDSKGIAYQTAHSDRQLSPADVSGVVRPFTAHDECEQEGAQSAAAPKTLSPPTATAGQPTLEQFNQCLDPYSSLDQTIKQCTAVIEWMTATASALGNSSRESYPVAQASFYKLRGAAYHQKGQYDLAIADFTEAIYVNPMDSDAYYHRGEAREDKRDYGHAIEDFTKAFVSGKASAATRVGHIYSETRDYRMAMQWFQAGAEKGDAGAMDMIGVFYVARIPPDCTSARIWIEKAIAAGDELAKQQRRSGFDGRCTTGKCGAVSARFGSDPIPADRVTAIAPLRTTS
jgi:hypothetical protein